MRNAGFRPVYSTDPVFYTVVHRRKGDPQRFPYRCGLRSQDLALVREFAMSECRSGEFSYVKIVNSDTNETIQKLMSGGKML